MEVKPYNILHCAQTMPSREKICFICSSKLVILEFIPWYYPVWVKGLSWVKNILVKITYRYPKHINFNQLDHLIHVALSNILPKTAQYRQKNLMIVSSPHRFSNQLILRERRERMKKKSSFIIWKELIIDINLKYFFSFSSSFLAHFYKIMYVYFF